MGVKKYLDVRNGIIRGTCVSPDDKPPPPGLVPVADDFDMREVEFRTFDVQTGALGPPRPKQVVVGLRDFVRLFTDAEFADIQALVQAGDPATVRFDALAKLEPTVELTHPDVGRGLAYLAGADSPLRPNMKVLTAQRVRDIQAGTPPP